MSNGLRRLESDARFAFILIGLTFLVYGNTLRAQFVYDDWPVIVENPLIQKLSRANYLFGSPYWGMDIGQPKTFKGSLYRPLTMLTYSLNYYFGKLNPFGYHLINLLLHTAVALLLWMACLQLGLGQWTSKGAALLFAVLPIHVEAVSNVVGRAELLACFFLLISWLLVIRKTTPRKTALALVAFGLALLAKENAAIFPLALILSDVFSQPGRWEKIVRHRAATWAMFIMILLLYLEWRHFLLGGAFTTGGIPYFSQQNELIVLLTMSRFLLSGYLWPMASGIGLRADYSRPSFADAAPTDLAAWICVILLLILVVISIHQFIRDRSVIAFAFLFFCLTLFPVSNLIFRIEVIGAERFLYLPSIGFCIALGLLMTKRFEPSKKERGVAGVVMLAALILFYAHQTIRRNVLWQNEETFWNVMVIEAPQNPRAWNGLGVAYERTGNFVTAKKYFQKALSIDPSLAWAGFNLAETSFLMGNIRAAEKDFKAIVERNPYEKDSLLYLGVIADQSRDYPKAALFYSRALAIDPFNLVARRNLGLLYCRTGRLEKGVPLLNRYIADAPREESNDVRRFLNTL